MRCSDCRDALGAYLDGELLLPEQQEIRDHIATCVDCAREHDLLATTSRTLKEGLVRHAAPDVLKARIRSSLAGAEHAAEPPRFGSRGGSWWQLAAAGIAIAVVSSGITLATTRAGSHTPAIENELLASHIRSLQPGHLTDVASTNQHNVKPWFNGRVDFSPTVPNLDSAGFPIVGGRLDYVEGRPVAVVVYGRRQHLINVYSWPSTGGEAREKAETRNGYHFIEWRHDGNQLWAVSDLNTAELEQFVALYNGGGI